MFSYPVKDNEATNRARERVLAYIKVGADEQQRLIEYCARNIPRDRYVPPHLMAFDIARLDDSPPSAAPLVINYAIGPRSTPWETREALKIHKHALGQLCDISNLKRPYMTFLNDDREDSWKRELLANTLERENWNVAATARVLDLTRTHVYNLLATLSIRRPDVD